MQVSKPSRVKNSYALEIVRGLQCCACGAGPPSEPHHPSSGGMGTKCSDLLVVPLCHKCHSELHDHGKETFERNHPGYLDKARGTILGAWANERGAGHGWQD